MKRNIALTIPILLAVAASVYAQEFRQGYQRSIAYDLSKLKAKRMKMEKLKRDNI